MSIYHKIDEEYLHGRHLGRLEFILFSRMVSIQYTTKQKSLQSAENFHSCTVQFDRPVYLHPNRAPQERITEWTRDTMKIKQDHFPPYWPTLVFIRLYSWVCCFHSQHLIIHGFWWCKRTATKKADNSINHSH